MVNNSPHSLDATFGALSDATRRGILARLAEGEATVSDLAAPCKMSLPAVSKHIRVLESAGLITRRKVGRVHRCRLTPAPMKNAAAWIDSCKQFWEQQFDALATYLEKQSDEEESPWQAHGPKQHSKSAAPTRHRAKKSSRPGPSPAT
jgi:DNA-binding transcriptional ArsR family regulator